MTFDDLEFKPRQCFSIQAIVFFDNKYGTLGWEEGKYELAVLYDYDGDRRWLSEHYACQTPTNSGENK